MTFEHEMTNLVGSNGCYVRGRSVVMGTQTLQAQIHQYYHSRQIGLTAIWQQAKGTPGRQIFECMSILSIKSQVADSPEAKGKCPKTELNRRPRHY